MYKQNIIMPCVQKAKAKAVFIKIYFRFRASLLFVENKITSRFFLFVKFKSNRQLVKIINALKGNDESRWKKLWL